jgi:amidase
MSQDDPTRRATLQGLAAASLLTGASKSQSSASPLCFTSAMEMARLIRAKKLSAREALAVHLKQIERVNPKLNAIVTLVPDMAAADAALADEMQAHNQDLGSAPWSACCAQRPDGDPRYSHHLRLAAF